MSVKGQMSKEDGVFCYNEPRPLVGTLNFSAKSKIWEKFAEVHGCWCAYWTSNPRILRNLRMVGSIPTRLRHTECIAHGYSLMAN
jgi:hypothetical protein